MYVYHILTHIHVYMCFFFSDNDECSLGTHNCIQTCTNTEGSFYCRCSTGFQLNSDGATCNGEYYMKHTRVHRKKHNVYVQNHTYISNHLDIDECSDGTHDCSQTCTNTEGSFICGCNSGYKLEVNGTTCNGMYKPLVLFW